MWASATVGPRITGRDHAIWWMRSIGQALQSLAFLWSLSMYISSSCWISFNMTQLVEETVELSGGCRAAFGPNPLRRVACYGEIAHYNPGVFESLLYYLEFFEKVCSVLVVVWSINIGCQPCILLIFEWESYANGVFTIVDWFTLQLFGVPTY